MSEMTKKTNGDRPATQADLAGAETALRSEMAGMKTALQSEMSDMKTELRSEMSDMKTELRSEMSDMKKELKADIARVAVGLVKTQDRLQRVEENMATKADIRTVIGHIDGLTKGLSSYEYRLAVRKHQLQDHERRIDALEKS